MTAVTVRARVQLTVEIDVSDVWGGDCPTSQVFDQAKAAALAVTKFMPRPYRVIGEPAVSAVLVAEDR